MKLNKRLYLLTPLLVLCCVIAAGIITVDKSNVQAEIELDTSTSDYRIYEYSESTSYEYESTTMEQFLSENNSEYEIRTLDAYLFDYNGDAWNKYWYGETDSEDYFAFVNGNTSTDDYAYNSGMNLSGTHLLEIVAENLDGTTNSPVFQQNPYTGDQGTDVGNLLFNPSCNANVIIDNFRTVYDTSFQFVYNPETQMYKYNSGTNHAQLELTGDSEGVVVQYADVVSPDNKVVSQMDVYENADYYGINRKDVTREYTYGESNSNGEVYDSTKYNIAHDATYGGRIHFKNFYTPTGSGGTKDWVDSIQSGNVYYLYFDIAIAAENSFSDTITVFLNHGEDEEKSLEIPYNCSGNDLDANRMQLKIPMEDITEGDDIEIIQITISPVPDDCNAGQDVSFEIWEYGIVYKNGSTLSDDGTYPTAGDGY